MAGHQAAGSAGGSPKHAPGRGRRAPAAVPNAEQLAALKLLREPFPPQEVSQRPKITCRACAAARTRPCDRAGHHTAWCGECRRFLTSEHIHVDFVGHAAATARLLEVDPLWDWEPLALTAQGLPALDQHGGLWMRLTVCGMTRLGYGDADGKPAGPDAMKEIIGDGIRNAGMRFGMALELWLPRDTGTAPAPEPTRERRILARLGEARVWNSERGLHAMLQDAVDGCVADIRMEEADWRSLREVVEERLAHLATAAAQHEKQDRRPVPPPAGRDDPDDGPAPADATPPPRAGEPVPDHPLPTREQAELVLFHQRLVNGWNSLDATRMALAEALAKGYLAAQVPRPGTDGTELLPVEELLADRIAELRRPGQHPAPEPGPGPAADSTTPVQEDQQEGAA